METTYRTANEGAYFCTALMRACRALAAETAHALYGAHVFDFGADVEAVRPFLSDLAPATRGLVRRVSLYKRGPWLFDSWSDRCEWKGSEYGPFLTNQLFFFFFFIKIVCSGF